MPARVQGKTKAVCRKCWKYLPIAAFASTSTRGSNVATGAHTYTYLRRDCNACSRRGARSKYSAMKKAGFPERPPLGTKCALCPDTSTRLVHDHCHRTDTLRAALCNSCNTGVMRADLEQLRAAYELQYAHLVAQGVDLREHDRSIDARLVSQKDDVADDITPLAIELELGGGCCTGGASTSIDAGGTHDTVAPVA